MSNRHSTSPVIDELIESLKSLPGLGPRSASRIAHHLLVNDRGSALRLAQALDDACRKVGRCEYCNTLSESSICAICADQERDHEQLCIVESPTDQRVIEETMTYHGLYFVLMGLISPVQGVGASELGLEKLMTRIEASDIKEVMIATPYTPEGDATAHFIAQAIKSRGFDIHVTRLARGVPAGVELEYTDANTIANAIFARR